MNPTETVDNACTGSCSSSSGGSEVFMGCHGFDCAGDYLLFAISSVPIPHAGSAGRGGSAEERGEPQERRMQGHTGGKCWRTSAPAT